MEKQVILVVEDERTISNFICRALTAAGYKPLTAATGGEALTLFYSHAPALVLLDLGLPDRDGMDVLAEVRAAPKPAAVLIISARDREAEKVKALDMGADDYVVKPFGVPELLARIRAALRRAEAAGEAARSEETPRRWRVKDLTVDAERHQVFMGEEEVHLTQNEFKILELLCRYPGKVLTYDFLLKQVWGPHSGSSNQILRVNLANMRRKLKEDPSAPKYILTELGVGYRLLDE